jgi:hypothetical protein
MKFRVIFDREKLQPARGAPGLLLLFIMPALVNAQAIDTNRPGFSFSPNVVARGQWQLETGVAYDRPGDSTQSWSLPLAEFRLGVSSGIEVFVSSISWTDAESNGNTTSGLVDAVVGTKIALGDTMGRTSMAVLFQVSVPVGDSDLTSDNWDPSAGFIWAHDGTLPLAGTVKVTRFDDFYQLDNGLKMPFAISDGHSAFVEWEANLPEGRDDSHWLNGGYQWLLQETLQLDLNAGVGLNSTAGDYRLGAGFSMRF